MGEICERNNILVISDEVHQDLIFSEDARHIPFAMLKMQLLIIQSWARDPTSLQYSWAVLRQHPDPIYQLRRAYQAQSEPQQFVPF